MVPGCCSLVVPPTSRAAPGVVTPGMRTAAPWMLRAAGSTSSTSRVNTVCFVTLCTSTSGVTPDTVIVSSSVPTLMSALTVAVKFPVNSMPSRFTDAKPASAKVTV